MNFVRKSVRASSLLLAAASLFSVSMAAQQEVNPVPCTNPDRCDEQPAVASKPATKTHSTKNAAQKPAAARPAVAKTAKPAPKQAAALSSKDATVPGMEGRR